MLNEIEIQDLENLLDRLERNHLAYLEERELLNKIISENKAILKVKDEFSE